MNHRIVALVCVAAAGCSRAPQTELTKAREEAAAKPEVEATTQDAAHAPRGAKQSVPLTSRELSGSWRGEKDGVKVRVMFRDDGDMCPGDTTWFVEAGNATIGADLDRVDDEESGSVLLRFDYRDVSTGKKGSAVFGRLERDTAGTLRLAILPTAESFAEYKPVDRIALAEAADEGQ